MIAGYIYFRELRKGVSINWLLRSLNLLVNDRKISSRQFWVLW